jgi:hypothetical protein
MTMVDPAPKKSLIAKLFSFFHKNESTSARSIEDTLKVEPKYWPEVVDFMNQLKTIVNKNTIDDGNVHSLNDRIISYVEKEINQKGKLPDIEKRYAALDELADRILVVSLGKIVGMKKTSDTQAVFTDAVTHLKNALHERKRVEEQYLHSKH